VTEYSTLSVALAYVNDELGVAFLNNAHSKSVFDTFKRSAPAGITI